MPKYIQITDTLSLVMQDIKSKATSIVKVREPVNHIWIYDRSGSMTYLLPDLTEQLVKLSKDLPRGDSLTLGWFSGEGSYNFIFKGFKVTDKSDYKALEKAIRDNSHSMGTTCFSEILANVDTVVKDLSVLSTTFALNFFTDGYPVVSNYPKEIESIFNAIEKIKGQLSAAMLVGYGTYYNKELMADMAQRMGAILIHSSLINEYSQNITRLVQLADAQEPKEKIEPIIANPLATFMKTDQGIVLQSVNRDGSIYVNPQKGKTISLFYLSTEKPNKKSWDRIEPKDVNFGDMADTVAAGMYASALVLTQLAKTDLALEVLGKIGDKAMIDEVTNAYTLEEYGRVEQTIEKGINTAEGRYVNGKDMAYLPPTDAFCVFDLLNLLVEDSESKFYPYHEKFHYDRIGVASKVRDDYSKFVPNKGISCPFNALIWHSSHLNLSIQTKVKGTVELKPRDGKAAQDFGFANPYPAFVFRNFTFIKDGRVNVKKFFVTTSESTYGTLKNHGLVSDDTFRTDGTYSIDMSKLPSINRKIATGRTSAKELAKLSLQEQKLKAQVKALKFLTNAEVEEEEKVTVSFTDEQAAFLDSNGIDAKKGGIYAPPVDRGEAKDQYLAKTFEIKISGLMSIPTVKKVIEKTAGGKKLTPVEELVNAGIAIYEKAKGGLRSDADKAKWFQTSIAKLSAEMREIRTHIQETKFAVLVGKKWFDEFTDRSETKLDLDGITYNFEVGEEQVEI